jgi:hypothetical protein
MLELRVATADPWLTVALDGLDGFSFDDEARVVSEAPITAALH